MLTKNQAKRIDASLSLVDKETSTLFKAIGMPGKSLKKIKANAIEAKKISVMAADMIVKSMKNKNDIIVASSYPAVSNLHQKAVSMAARADLIIRASEAEMDESDEFKDLPEEDLTEELDEEVVEADDDEVVEDETVEELEDDEVQEDDDTDELDDEVEAEELDEDELVDDEMDDELLDEEPVAAKRTQNLRRASVRKNASNGAVSGGKVNIKDKAFWGFI